MGKDIPTAKQAADRLFQIVDRESAIDPEGEGGTKLERVSGDIELKEIVFAYPAAPDHVIANGFSIKIDAGQTVALCGPSGCGKSTTIALLERFYDPQAGIVTIDGVDIKTMNVKWLRSVLGLVGQEPV